jgi:PEP-CTERM motif
MPIAAGSTGLQRLGWAVAAAAALAAGSPAAADPANYSFTLTGTGSFSYAGVVGSGTFTVDEASVPAVGSFEAVATDLSGVLVTSRGFGYAFGNEINRYLGGDPADPRNMVLIRKPHTDAVVSFEDGVPTGIRYDEVHTCDGGPYRCSPNHQIHFLGARFDVFEYPALSASGELTISPAIPEPNTVALMGAGLVAIALAMQRHR